MVFAAASDESRPILTGVLTRFAGETVTLAAADNYRIAVRTLTVARPVGAELTIVVRSIVRRADPDPARQRRRD